jgi:large subunit ribosomal protein L13
VYKGTAHPHEAQQPLNITAEIDARPKDGPGAALLASKQ